ncbi:hypothetical protein LWI28_026143 [Acer negundo]|uniref:Receptor-like protein 12 n=1 Tax=Acer negundo TaxID=4023 RepID=A0AAD5J8D9_ACENE|nr:hypothetical protein LWI28_026143 [Acer negundo]
MFAKLKNLERLSLSDNSLSISTTFKVNSSFPKLISLDLSSCNINEFPEILSAADNLEMLDLADNKIHGHIPNWLFNISNLSYLYLSNNFLTGSIEQLPWKGLRYLDLSLNQLSGPIPSSIFEQVNLTYLDLSYNSLSMSTTLKVNSSFPKLYYLSLSSCNINEFPEIVSTANNLEWLELSDNKIHGHIPNWLFNISTLSHVNISHNFVTGIERLPWKDLQNLDLHSNLLQGLLPPPPPKLYFFSVSHNILTGAIPSSFCNLSSLQYLDLSNNSLSGVIPQCLGNSSNIWVLDLKMNNFHGSIPQTFANGCRLTTLNLNSNRLAGSLPPSLANCGNLEVLDVGNNKINGTFPHWLATLSQLQVLILRSNRFYGTLGDSTTRLRFTMLRILDLSHNSFTGHLQTRFFRKFQAMMSGKNNSAEMKYMGDSLYKDSIMVTMKGFEIEMQRVLTIFTAMDLSSNRENDGDIKRHGPESPPGISESSKGFREMSTGLKALNKSSLKKMKMKMGS